MKGLRRIIWLAPVLTACASQPQPKTIGDLEKQPLSEEDRALEVTHEQAIERYQQFLASSPDHERQAEALKRLADLELDAEGIARTCRDQSATRSRRVSTEHVDTSSH